MIEAWDAMKMGELVTLSYGKGIKDYRHQDGQFDVYGTNGKIGSTDEFLYDKPSLIIGRKGAYRGVHLALKPFSVIDTAFYTQNNYDELDVKFLFYWFQTFDLDGMDSGSAIPSTSRDEVYDIDIALPPLPEQKAIAGVLSSLDDKIDLLHRQNKTLEALAETLFRQWFIEGAEDDWEERPLDEIADYLNGLACQKYPPKNKIDRLPVLKIKDLKNGISDSSDWASTDVDKKYIVENGDVIFSWSASLLVKIWDGETCILNQHLFKVTSEAFPKWFIYLWTKHHLDRFIAIARAKATTMGHIRRKDISASMVVVPDSDTLTDFGNSFAPMLEKIISNNRQVKTLENQRDTLLPKLMSGEVRVRFDEAA